MTSTRTFESALVAAPVAKVWARLRAMDFTWWDLVKETTVTTGAAPAEVGSTHKITYKDGSDWTVKLVEMSDIDTFLTYEVVASSEALKAMSAVHTLRARRVTATSQTFVEWTTDFSSDANVAVIEDSRFKKLEAFKDLQKTCTA